MTNSSTASAQDKIEYLATKVMGWKKYDRKGYKMWHFPVETGGAIRRSHWNPLENWNHWRQVEEKVMEDCHLWTKFSFIFAEDPEMGNGLMIEYMHADLPTRVSALISAHQELYGK